jgi:hypothetical protein
MLTQGRARVLIRLWVQIPRVVSQLQSHRQYLFMYLDALFDKDPHLAFDYSDLQVCHISRKCRQFTSNTRHFSHAGRPLRRVRCQQAHGLSPRQQLLQSGTGALACTLIAFSSLADPFQSTGIQDLRRKGPRARDGVPSRPDGGQQTGAQPHHRTPGGCPTSAFRPLLSSRFESRG